MDPDEENISPPQVPGSLRRSERISRSEKKLLTPDMLNKTKEKPAKRSAEKKKSMSGKKSKLGHPSKERQSTDEFNGSYLTPEELQQLLIKFTRDGHFRVSPPNPPKPPNPSPPPFVISRTTDGKFVTTRIECYDKKIMREVASTLTSQKTADEGPKGASNSTSVTFCVPVAENPPGNSLPADSNADPSTNLSDKNVAANRQQNSGEETQNAFSDQQRNSGGGNATSDNSAGPNPQLKSVSTAENGQANKFAITSGFSAFNSRQILPMRPNPMNPMNPMFAGPAASSWIPPGQSTLENPNGPIACGISYPNNEAQYHRTSGSQETARFDSEASKNYSQENVDPANLANRYNYWNSSAGNHGATYQHSATNAQDPLQISLANSWGSSNNWNAAGQTGWNAFNSGYGVACNSQTGSFNNHPHDVSPSNSSTSDNNGYLYFTAWDNGQYYPNSCVSTAADPAYCAYSNAYNVSEKKELEPIIGDQASHVDSWSQDDRTDNVLFDADEKVTVDSSPIEASNFASNATIDSNVDSGTGTGLSQSSNEQIISEVCSYNDISYDTYMGQNFARGTGISEPKAQKNELSSPLPSVTTIRTEMRSWYGGDNCLYGNNVQSTDARDADCFIVDVVRKTSART